MLKKILLFVLVVSGTSQLFNCKNRGGCSCDCSWTSRVPCSKARDDRSCCYSCCCLENKTPISPISPIKPPVNPMPTMPVSPISLQKLYCPSSKDLVAGYGTPTIFDQGWLNKGGGSVATKSAFNLIDGYVEFDIDFTNTQPGVNGNIYTISPKNIPSVAGFTQKNYCDGAKKEIDKWCVEIDWIESNGNCGGAVTLHTIIGTGNGCTAWGCREHFMYSGKTSYHVKMVYDNLGRMTMYRDNQIIGPNDIKPNPLDSDWKTLYDAYVKEGAVIYSSLWKGWVPLEKTCQNNGDLASSSFQVKNLKIKGIVVQGPEPSICV